jgi:hypothetical protein
LELETFHTLYDRDLILHKYNKLNGYQDIQYIGMGLHTMSDMFKMAMLILRLLSHCDTKGDDDDHDYVHHGNYDDDENYDYDYQWW